MQISEIRKEEKQLNVEVQNVLTLYQSSSIIQILVLVPFFWSFYVNCNLHLSSRMTNSWCLSVIFLNLTFITESPIFWKLAQSGSNLDHPNFHWAMGHTCLVCMCICNLTTSFMQARIVKCTYSYSPCIFGSECWIHRMFLLHTSLIGWFPKCTLSSLAFAFYKIFGQAISNTRVHWGEQWLSYL